MSLLENLPFGLKPDDLIVLMAAATATLTVLMLWFALMPPDPGTARVQALARRREQMKAEALTPKRRQAIQAVTFMREVVTRLKLVRTKQAESIHWKLARAGKRSQDAVIVYLFAKVALPIAAAVGSVVLLFVVEVSAASMQMRLVYAAAAVVAAAIAPDVYLKNCADKRSKALHKALPDGLDLMVICAEAGLSLDAGLNRVAKEMGRGFPELADEFALTAVELGFLPERRMALDNLASRVTLPGIRGMVNTLVQAERYGTPLAQSLRVLAAELRMERMMKAEEKAARLPATLTVPMILFILPPLFIVLMGPAALSVIDSLRGLGL